MFDVDDTGTDDDPTFVTWRGRGTERLPVLAVSKGLGKEVGGFLVKIVVFSSVSRGPERFMAWFYVLVTLCSRYSSYSFR